MSPFIAEIIGTAILILLGDGVVANVVLKDTLGENSGWIVITWGWGMAVFVAVFCVAAFSGAHINPAVTVGLAAAGIFPWASVPLYLAGQFIGAAIGAFLVWLHYRPHFATTDDADAKLGVFCTGPAIPDVPANFISEVIGTVMLVFAVLYLTGPSIQLNGLETALGNGAAIDTAIGLGALDALPVGLVVLVIGLALGGTTGYAINPARDLSPRLMHQILPIPGKRDSNWGYAWIPVVGPLVGGVLAALLGLAIGGF
ncbi:MIP/aquaporin family protein [Salisaeta longa]|uniref:MIP/aquaporin family protein n=1 Tax=Salisaeta longa TaxID=503170 RepID=UPI0003B4F422|nr:MIP/aquaporin family protein [Salisaeta longa]